MFKQFREIVGEARKIGGEIKKTVARAADDLGEYIHVAAASFIVSCKARRKELAASLAALGNIPSEEEILARIQGKPPPPLAGVIARRQLELRKFKAENKVLSEAAEEEEQFKKHLGRISDETKRKELAAQDEALSDAPYSADLRMQEMVLEIESAKARLAMQFGEEELLRILGKH